MSRTERFDRGLDAVQAVLLSLLIKLGPFGVALMPALFVAYAIFQTFRSEAGSMLALFFALTVALGIETVGIVSTHTALDLYNASAAGLVTRGKFWLMAGLVPLYAGGVSFVVWFADERAFTGLVRGLGVASPWLTAVVYVAVALARDIRRAEARQAEAEGRQAAERREARQFNRERRLLAMQYAHEEELARIDGRSADVRSGAEHPPESVERSPEYDERLAEVRERADGNPFGPVQVQDWLQIGRTTAYQVLDYGRKTGQIEQLRRGKYVASVNGHGQN